MEPAVATADSCVSGVSIGYQDDGPVEEWSWGKLRSTEVAHFPPLTARQLMLLRNRFEEYLCEAESDIRFVSEVTSSWSNHTLKRWNGLNLQICRQEYFTTLLQMQRIFEANGKLHGFT